MRTLAPTAIALSLSLAAASCGNSPGQSGTAATSSVSAAPPAPATPPAKAAMKLAVDPSGTATFDMKAPVENIKGLVSGFGGELEVDLADLTKTRGAVTMDMTTLETHTFGEEGKDKTQTEHALGWLEVGPKSPEDTRTRMQRATFTIKEVLAASPRSVQGAQGDRRSATLTVRGELSLHGKTAEKTAELACDFQLEGETLKSVSVKSAKPVPVSLKEHDVQPRDDKGEVVLAKVLELFGKKVAEEASVTFELVARPAGAPGAAPASR